jgi:hypothetical protein
VEEEEARLVRRRGVEEEEARLVRRRGVEEEVAWWGALVVGWAEVAWGWAQVARRGLTCGRTHGGRQIHKRAEKV